MRRVSCHVCESFLGAIEKGSSLKKGTAHLCAKCFDDIVYDSVNRAKNEYPDFMNTFFKGFRK